MINSAKCPKCEQLITNIHYEAHDPSSFSGYRGSPSFTAVAYPCGHAIGAVPISWEKRLEELDRKNQEINKKVDYLRKELGDIFTILSNLGSQKK